MATNFPSSVDSFTNPTTSDTLASVPHASQHADVNDAVEAIETALLDGAPLHIDDANERVGIGTTSPAHLLDVNGKVIVGGGDNQTPDASGNGHLMIDGAGYTGFNSLDGTAMWVGHNSGSRNLHLATDETARVTVSGGGNVGIGDTTPSYKLDVNGDINSTGKFYQNGGVYGGVVQFLSSSIGTAVGSTTSTYADTGLSITLTPKSSSNRLLLQFFVPCSKNSGNSYNSLGFSLVRDSTAIYYTNGFLYTGSLTNSHGVWTQNYWTTFPDSSSHTWKLQFANHPYAGSGGTVYVAPSTGAGYQFCTMYAIEVAQ